MDRRCRYCRWSGERISERQGFELVLWCQWHKRPATGGACIHFEREPGSDDA